MAEIGISYVLQTGAARAVFGNNDSALADADFAGYLDSESGISQLLDPPQGRLGGGDKPGGDGGYDSGGLVARRTGTISGWIPPVSMADTNARLSKLDAALQCVAVDGALSWTPSGSTIERMIRVRRQSGPEVTGRRPKKWQATLTSRDPWPFDTVERVNSSAGTVVGSYRNLPMPTNDGQLPALVWYRWTFFGSCDITTTTFPFDRIVGVNKPGGGGDTIDLFPETGQAFRVSDGLDVYSWIYGAGTTGGGTMPILWDRLIPEAGETQEWQIPAGAGNFLECHMRRRWFR